MDAGVRALYIDLISSYIEALLRVHRIQPDTEVRLSLLSDKTLDEVLDLLRHLYRLHKQINVRGNS